MKLVHVYLNFPGTTEEAFRYYETVFGTRIAMMQTFGDTPFVSNVPEAAKKKIMHAQLPITDAVHLMGSDVVEGLSPPVKWGTNFHVSVVASDKAEADRAFAALSSGGKVNMPLANAPWGPYFGMCADRFGVQWMVSLPHPV
jgi:PhnB protein